MGRNELQATKLAHIIYPGDDNKDKRDEAIALIKSFNENRRKGSPSSSRVQFVPVSNATAGAPSTTYRPPITPMQPNVSTPIYTSVYGQPYAQNIGGSLSQENSQISRLMEQMQLMQAEIQRLHTQNQQPSYNVLDNGFHQGLQQQAVFSPSPFGIANQTQNQASSSRNPDVSQMPQERNVSPTGNNPTSALLETVLITPMYITT